MIREFIEPLARTIAGFPNNQYKAFSDGFSKHRFKSIRLQNDVNTMLVGVETIRNSNIGVDNVALIEKYFRYTDADIKKVLDNMTILCDTREKENTHIITEFDRLKTKHMPLSLATGDYSVMVPQMIELGITRPMFFNNAIVVERKANLDELANNIGNERERLKDEFTRANLAGTKIHLLIEDANGYENILSHNYKSKLSEKAYLASLMSFQHKYGLNIVFLPKKFAGIYINHILYYFIRNTLKG